MKNLNKEDYPIYLHTHPSSFRAIKLYSDFGFHLISDPVIGYRNNDLNECLPILKNFIPEKEYEKIKISKAPSDFLDIVASAGKVNW